MFATGKPRGFHHEMIYGSTRRERVSRMAERHRAPRAHGMSALLLLALLALACLLYVLL